MIKINLHLVQPLIDYFVVHSNEPKVYVELENQVKPIAFDN